MHFLITVAAFGPDPVGTLAGLPARAAFEIRIQEGHPRVVRGTVTKAFLGEIRALCLHDGVTWGTVRGQIRGNQIGLDLREPLPPAYRQQLRNVWVMSEWSAGRGWLHRVRLGWLHRVRLGFLFSFGLCP